LGLRLKNAKKSTPQGVQVLRIRGHVHDPHDVQLGAEETLIANGLENHAADAPESVDADLGRHCNFDNGILDGESKLGCLRCLSHTRIQRVGSTTRDPQARLLNSYHVGCFFTGLAVVSVSLSLIASKTTG
jgi:hypothetical protein